MIMRVVPIIVIGWCLFVAGVMLLLPGSGWA
jgi:hypothetical protein